MNIHLITTRTQANAAYDLTLEMIQSMGYTENPLRDEFVGNLLKHKKQVAMFLAEVKGKPVGIAMVSGDFSPYEGGFYGFYKSLYVTPEARGGNVAEALFEAIRTETKKRGWKGLHWKVHRTNKASQGFFTKHTKPAHKASEGVYVEYWIGANEL